MRTNVNEITVHRNETFTLDKYIVTQNGDPFILPKGLDNPYILVTVASKSFMQSNSYKKNWWLPLNTMPSFVTTNPINLDALVTSEGGSTPAYTSWPVTRVSAYLGDEEIIDSDDTPYVFYKETDGIKEFRYWTNGSYQEYVFELILEFSQQDTRQWVENDYLYSIFLVSGQDVSSTLHNLCNEQGIVVSSAATNKYMYDKLIEKNPDIFEGNDFNIDYPIGTFELVLPLLTPTKLSVISNLQGGMQ